MGVPLSCLCSNLWLQLVRVILHAVDYFLRSFWQELSEGFLEVRDVECTRNSIAEEFISLTVFVELLLCSCYLYDKIASLREKSCQEFNNLSRLFALSKRSFNFYQARSELSSGLMIRSYSFKAPYFSINGRALRFSPSSSWHILSGLLKI